jgi:hypothetical protein
LLTTREGRSVAISVITCLGTAEERLRDLGPLLVSFSLTEGDLGNLIEAFAGDPSPAMRACFESIRSFLGRDWGEVWSYAEEASANFGAVGDRRSTSGTDAAENTGHDGLAVEGTPDQKPCGREHSPEIHD